MLVTDATGPLLLAILAGCGRIGFDSASSGDAEPPRCFAVDEPFDGPGLPPSWRVSSRGGAPAPVVAGGAMVLDVISSLSAASVGVDLDLSELIATATIRDDPFVQMTQVYMLMRNRAVSRTFLQMAIAQGFMTARIQAGGTSDDVNATISPPPVFRIQLATRPMAGGTEITWRYSLSDTDVFVELRREIETTPLGNDELAIEYETFAPASMDPSPIRVEQLSVEVPCP